MPHCQESRSGSLFQIERNIYPSWMNLIIIIIRRRRRWWWCFDDVLMMMMMKEGSFPNPRKSKQCIHWQWMNNAILAVVVVVVVVASIKKKKLQIGAANYSQNWLPNCWQNKPVITAVLQRWVCSQSNWTNPSALLMVVTSPPHAHFLLRHAAPNFFFFFWGWVLDCSWLDQCNAAFAISM